MNKLFEFKEDDLIFVETASLFLSAMGIVLLASLWGMSGGVVGIGLLSLYLRSLVK